MCVSVWSSCRGVALLLLLLGVNHCPCLDIQQDIYGGAAFSFFSGYLLLLPASASLLPFVLLLLLSPSNARSFSSQSSSSSSAFLGLGPTAKVYLDFWFVPGLEFRFPSLQFLSDFCMICWPDFLLGPQDSSVGGGGGGGAWQLLKTLAVWLVVNFDSILVAVRILNFVLGEIVIAVENYEQ